MSPTSNCALRVLLAAFVFAFASIAHAQRATTDNAVVVQAPPVAPTAAAPTSALEPTPSTDLEVALYATMTIVGVIGLPLSIWGLYESVTAIFESDEGENTGLALAMAGTTLGTGACLGFVIAGPIALADSVERLPSEDLGALVWAAPRGVSLRLTFD